MKIKNTICCNRMRSTLRDKALLLNAESDGRIFIALPASVFTSDSDTEIYCCPFCGHSIKTEFVEQQ